MLEGLHLAPSTLVEWLQLMAGIVLGMPGVGAVLANRREAKESRIQVARSLTAGVQAFDLKVALRGDLRELSARLTIKGPLGIGLCDLPKPHRDDATGTRTFAPLPASGTRQITIPIHSAADVGTASFCVVGAPAGKVFTPVSIVVAVMSGRHGVVKRTVKVSL